ncbi:MAG: M20/M25/M40 family metallo-hydrolase, partial [Ornithinimicrobium sp.]
CSVATIGKIAVQPGGVNAIASHTTAWLDSRGPDEEPVRAVVAEVRERVERMGGRMAQESWTRPTLFDVGLSTRLRRLLAAPTRAEVVGEDGPGDAVPLLGSGAGHDAGILANAGIPVAMVFVRNPTGISHSPAEYAERADCHAGVNALSDCLAELVGPRAEPRR